MPTYEYRCRDCGNELEVVQSFHDAALTECPVCSGSLRKVFGNVGITFKGSGFYKTDSRSGSGSASKATSTGSESTTNGSSPTSENSSTNGTKESTATPAAAKPAASSD